MNKLATKIINITFLLVLVCSNFCVPDVAQAKTIRQLEQELNTKQAELQATENKKALTQAEINKTKGEITSIQNSISQTYTDISNLDKEIEQLNKDIAEKEEQIKQIVNYTQVSNGEEAYLEYAFGATDFTDFIYRMAISEQLTQYNKKLVNEFNNKIEESKKKQEEIAAKRVDLESKQKSLQTKMESLGSELSSVNDISVNIADEIAYQKELLEHYKNKGCGIDDELSTCGRTPLPAGTALFRPIASGYVTSFYGQRSFDFHRGIDLSTSITSPPVYAAGNGVVTAIWERFSCGGNMVFVNHNINGVRYTTLYAHLLSVNVTIDAPVTRNTIIGYMGGGSNTFGWDGCSTGQHLHFQIATGLYDPSGMGDYSSWAAFTARSIDPALVVNFPNRLYSDFSDRTSAY